jgi:hypothetical protein
MAVDPMVRRLRFGHVAAPASLLALANSRQHQVIARRDLCWPVNRSAASGAAGPGRSWPARLHAQRVPLEGEGRGGCQVDQRRDKRREAIAEEEHEGLVPGAGEHDVEQPGWRPDGYQVLPVLRRCPGAAGLGGSSRRRTTGHREHGGAAAQPR